MAKATKATPISVNPALVLTPAPGVLVEDPAGAADEVALVLVPPVDVGRVVVDAGPEVLDTAEVAAVVELEDTGTTVEEPDVPVEVVPAGTEVWVVEASGAEVAAAPVPVEVRTASRRDPLLPAATQVPATLLVIS